MLMSERNSSCELINIIFFFTIHFVCVCFVRFKRKSLVSLKSPTASLNLGLWLLIVWNISTLNWRNGRFPQMFVVQQPVLVPAVLRETIEQIWCFDGSLRIQLLTWQNKTIELHLGMLDSPLFREIDHWQNYIKPNESTINSNRLGAARSHIKKFKRKIR